MPEENKQFILSEWQLYNSNSNIGPRCAGERKGGERKGTKYSR